MTKLTNTKRYIAQTLQIEVASAVCCPTIHVGLDTEICRYIQLLSFIVKLLSVSTHQPTCLVI
jgi:hypothetical protein